MPLPPLRGHADARELLRRAAREGSLPQSILLHGPAGVGKERLALWLAALLVCERREGPCGECAQCRLVARLEHPDVHWFFPVQRPEGASAEKLRDRLEEERAAELQRWRENPYRSVEFEKPPAHYVASIRTLQKLAGMRPAIGSRKVFIVGDAEFMVPQEGTQEAANAFLKLLEEPPPETTFVLTSSQPGALLPTIRSRLLAVSVRLLPEKEIETLLLGAGVAADAATLFARQARGSARQALKLAFSPGERQAERRAGRDLLVAALATGPVARLAAANARRPAAAREMLGQLDSFAEWLRDLLAVVSGAPEQVSDPEGMPILNKIVEQRQIPAQGVIAAIGRVAEARDLAFGNVNPQLILADLLRRVQVDLGEEGRTQPVGAR
jgi:DNA polymerase-3 subunit delta'